MLLIRIGAKWTQLRLMVNATPQTKLLVQQHPKYWSIMRRIFLTYIIFSFGFLQVSWDTFPLSHCWLIVTYASHLVFWFCSSGGRGTSDLPKDLWTDLPRPLRTSLGTQRVVMTPGTSWLRWAQAPCIYAKPRGAAQKRRLRWLRVRKQRALWNHFKSMFLRKRCNYHDFRHQHLQNPFRGFQEDLFVVTLSRDSHDRTACHVPGWNSSWSQSWIWPDLGEIWREIPISMKRSTVINAIMENHGKTPIFMRIAIHNMTNMINM